MTKKVAEKICKLCDIILVYEDNLDLEKSKEYIRYYIDNNIVFNSNKIEIRYYVKTKVTEYIERCPSVAQLFTFASDNGYLRYRKSFFEYYHRYYKKSKKCSVSPDPMELEYIFDFIQETIDYYILHEKLSLIMHDDAEERTKKDVYAVAISAQIAAENAKKAADNVAHDVVNSVIEQVIKEKNLDKIIQDNVNKEVDNQTKQVTSKISETSVTILGIFSGIVLTVVAGLFYSSSVLENVNVANFGRLICVASLVGFVCYHLLALMFYYIDRFRNRKDCESFFNKTTRPISVILVIFFVISLVISLIPQFTNEGNNETTNTCGLDVNVSVSLIETTSTYNPDETTTDYASLVETTSTTNESLSPQ